MSLVGHQFGSVEFRTFVFIFSTALVCRKQQHSKFDTSKSMSYQVVNDLPYVKKHLQDIFKKWRISFLFVFSLIHISKDYCDWVGFIWKWGLRNCRLFRKKIEYEASKNQPLYWRHIFVSVMVNFSIMYLQTLFCGKGSLATIMPTQKRLCTQMYEHMLF